MLQSIVVGVSALQPESRMKSRLVRLANCFTGSTFRENVASSPPSAGLITTTTRVVRLAARAVARSVRYGLTSLACRLSWVVPSACRSCEYTLTLSASGPFNVKRYRAPAAACIPVKFTRENFAASGAMDPWKSFSLRSVAACPQRSRALQRGASPGPGGRLHPGKVHPVEFRCQRSDGPLEILFIHARSRRYVKTLGHARDGVGVREIPEPLGRRGIDPSRGELVHIVAPLVAQIGTIEVAQTLLRPDDVVEPSLAVTHELRADVRRLAGLAQILEKHRPPVTPVLHALPIQHSVVRPHGAAQANADVLIVIGLLEPELSIGFYGGGNPRVTGHPPFEPRRRCFHVPQPERIVLGCHVRTGIRAIQVLEHVEQLVSDRGDLIGQIVRGFEMEDVDVDVLRGFAPKNATLQAPNVPVLGSQARNIDADRPSAIFPDEPPTF